MHDRARRVVLVSIVTASVLTTAFGVALSARAPKDCCGADQGGGNCILEAPLHGCFLSTECDVDFPVCCETGGYCK